MLRQHAEQGSPAAVGTGAVMDGSEDEDAEDEGRGPARPVRFHGVVSLDPERLSRDFGKVATEVVSHLAALLGADLEVSLEIAARNDEGFPDNTVRNVSENARTLRFDEFGFEER